MNAQTFEIISQGLRYWIAGLTVFIFLRAARAVRRSFKVEKRREKREQGGYALGVLEIVAAENNGKLLGNRYVLRKENRIGKGADCDIRIPDRSVAPVQALIYQRGNKVFLSDYGSKKGVGLNGYRVTDDVALMDGDEIQLSATVLQLQLQQAYSAKRRQFEERQPLSLEEEGPGRYGEMEETALWEDDYDDDLYEEQEDSSGEYDWTEEERDPYDPE